jgi:hypothetical protein
MGDPRAVTVTPGAMPALWVVRDAATGAPVDDVVRIAMFVAVDRPMTCTLTRRDSDGRLWTEDRDLVAVC